MRSCLVLISALGCLLIAGPTTRAEAPAAEAPAKVVRIGAVAYSPSVVTVFQDMTKYLAKHDFAADYVLYSNYDSLVAALDKGEVDIAWNTPLAHAQYHVRNGCRSQTLVMRDVDVNVRSLLVVREDSGIKSLADLEGKKLILGSEGAAEATVLPRHFLGKQGAPLKDVAVLSLDQEVDYAGNPCCSPRHVLEALQSGRGDAGVITEGEWPFDVDKQDTFESLKVIWVSPPFSHCVFTAAKDFDPLLGERFTQLMTAMDPDDSATSQVMSLEGTRKWLPGSPDGFEDLVAALQAKE